MTGLKTRITSAALAIITTVSVMASGGLRVDAASKAPNKPVITSLKFTDTKTVISWESVECDGYELSSINSSGGEIAVADFKPDKTKATLKRTSTPGLNAYFDFEGNKAKLSLKAYNVNSDGDKIYSKASTKTSDCETYVPSIDEIRYFFADGIKIIDKKFKPHKPNTKSYPCYSFKTGYDSSKRSKSTYKFTSADRKQIKAFAKKYFDKKWTAGEKTAFTLLWIHRNVTYDYKRKYAGKYSIATCIFKYRYGQCTQYNGALVEMMNYLGLDAYLVVSKSSKKGSWQHYRAFIKTDKNEYSIEVGNYKTSHLWRWLMRKNDPFLPSKKDTFKGFADIKRSMIAYYGEV